MRGLHGEAMPMPQSAEPRFPDHLIDGGRDVGLRELAKWEPTILAKMLANPELMEQTDRYASIVAAASLVEIAQPIKARGLVDKHRWAIDRGLTKIGVDKRGYLFREGGAVDRVAYGKADTVDLMLVAHSMQQTYPAVRPWQPGWAVRRTQKTKTDWDDSLTMKFESNVRYERMQRALAGFVQNHGYLGYKPDLNPGHPFNGLLAHMEIFARLGLYDTIDVTREHLLRNHYMKLICSEAQTVRVRGNTDGGSEYKGWSERRRVEAMQGFLSDRWEYTQGNRTSANMRSRRWRYLTADGSGWRSYSAYLREREADIPLANNEYERFFQLDTPALHKKLAYALEANNADLACNVCSVLMQRNAAIPPQLLPVAQKLCEPHLQDTARFLQNNLRVPRWAKPLLADCYLQHRPGYQRQFQLLTPAHGSLEEDYRDLGGALSKSLENVGDNFGVRSKMLDFAIARRLYADEYSRYKRAREGSENANIKPVQYAFARLQAVCLAVGRLPSYQGLSPEARDLYEYALSTARRRRG